MPDVLSHEVVLIGLKDLEFKVGATLTKIKGAVALSIDTVGKDQLVEGDDGIIAYAAQKMHAKVSVTQAIMSLTSKAALQGDTVTESGTTPNVIATFEVKEGMIPTGTLTGQVKYIKGATGFTGTLPADAHLVMPAFTLDPNSMKDGFKLGEKNTIDFAGTVIPDSSGIIYKILFHETATPIT